MNDKDKQILRLVFKGKTAKEIGKELFLSPRTVESRLSRLRDRYGCRKTIELLTKKDLVNLLSS